MRYIQVVGPHTECEHFSAPPVFHTHRFLTQVMFFPMVVDSHVPNRQAFLGHSKNSQIFRKSRLGTSEANLTYKDCYPPAHTGLEPCLGSDHEADSVNEHIYETTHNALTSITWKGRYRRRELVSNIAQHCSGAFMMKF